MNSLALLPHATIPGSNFRPPADLMQMAGCETRLPRAREIKENLHSMGNGTTDDGFRDQLEGLIAAVATNQDRVAFQAIFEFFAPRLRAFMHRQGTNQNIVEEIVQETMVNVWRKARQFDPAKTSVSTWIYTIARNQRIDQLRKENRPVPDMNDPALVPDPEPEHHDVIARDQGARRLRAAIATLPLEQKQVLRLAFFKEKAHPEVAKELGIPLGTVKSRIRLALQRIRVEIGDER